MVCHFKYSLGAKSEIIEILNKYNVDYTLDSSTDNVRLVHFTLDSTMENFDTLRQELTVASKDTFSHILGEKRFEDSELDAAPYLEIIPTKPSIKTIGLLDCFSHRCEDSEINKYYHIRIENHFYQTKPLSIQSEPKISGRRGFWMDDGEIEIFTDFRIRKIVEENALSGFEFKPVYLKKGGASENAFQLSSTNILDLSCIPTGYGETVEYCRKCGNPALFHVNNIYQIPVDFTKVKNKSEDLYMTERIYGNRFSHSLFIISQRFYQLLKKNKLDGGLRFVPIIEI